MFRYKKNFEKLTIVSVTMESGIFESSPSIVFHLIILSSLKERSSIHRIQSGLHIANDSGMLEQKDT